MDERKNAGMYNIEWDQKDDNGKQVGKDKYRAVISCGKNEENVAFDISSNTNHVAFIENIPYISMKTGSF